jgi:hypothetical protein
MTMKLYAPIVWPRFWRVTLTTGTLLGLGILAARIIWEAL